MTKKFDKTTNKFITADLTTEEILIKARELDTLSIDYKIINGQIVITDEESIKIK